MKSIIKNVGAGIARPAKKYYESDDSSDEFAIFSCRAANGRSYNITDGLLYVQKQKGHPKGVLFGSKEQM